MRNQTTLYQERVARIRVQGLGRPTNTDGAVVLVLSEMGNYTAESEMAIDGGYTLI